MADFHVPQAEQMPVSRTHRAGVARSTAVAETTTGSKTIAISLFVWLAMAAVSMSLAFGNEALQRQASWQRYELDEMAGMLRTSLDAAGALPRDIDLAADRFIEAVENQDADPLDALIAALRPIVPSVDKLVLMAETSLVKAGESIDPSSATYGEIESLPKMLRMSVKTWLGRELVRVRLYDEALPVIAEVDPIESIDPASVLFFRGVCYHSLLMKKEALADLRRLLENEDYSPVRFVRTAKMMIADIKPLKEDSLDEISRLMTDVSRRLDLGRANEDVENRTQQIIDKLSKIIDKVEQEQQQQQQQQQQSAGGLESQGSGQGAPMADSRIAGASGSGDVDLKKRKDRNGWGNLPPAERQQAIQQISRDLPTHYREAIEAYFRKMATEGS